MSRAEEAAIDCAKKATPPLNAVGAYQARYFVMFLEGVKWVLSEARKQKKDKDGYLIKERLISLNRLESLIK